MTQKDLADMTGIRPTTILNLFNETTRFISLEHLDIICEILECDVCDILTRRKHQVEQAEKLARRLIATKDEGFMKLMESTAGKILNAPR